MHKAELKSFAKPDAVQTFPYGRLEVIRLRGAAVVRAVFAPGWRWSTAMRTHAGARHCELSHFQYHVSGALRIRMRDGLEFDCMAGDVSSLPAGHDAWVVGDEPVVVVDFQGVFDHARQETGHEVPEGKD